MAFEERFIVAKEGGRVIAAARVVAMPGRMSLRGFVAVPRVREGEVACEVYRGVAGVARELGIPEVRVDDDRRRESLLAAGFRRRLGGWRRDASKESAVPFFGRLGI